MEGGLLNGHINLQCVVLLELPTTKSHHFSTLFFSANESPDHSNASMRSIETIRLNPSFCMKRKAQHSAYWFATVYQRRRRWLEDHQTLFSYWCGFHYRQAQRRGLGSPLAIVHRMDLQGGLAMPLSSSLMRPCRHCAG